MSEYFGQQHQIYDDREVLQLFDQKKIMTRLGQ